MSNTKRVEGFRAVNPSSPLDLLWVLYSILGILIVPATVIGAFFTGGGSLLITAGYFYLWFEFRPERELA